MYESEYPWTREDWERSVEDARTHAYEIIFENMRKINELMMLADQEKINIEDAEMDLMCLSGESVEILNGRDEHRLLDPDVWIEPHGWDYETNTYTNPWKEEPVS